MSRIARLLSLTTTISAAALAATPAFAHHPGTGGGAATSGPINIISATTLERGQGAAAVLFEMIKLAPLGNDTLETLAGQHVHAHSLDRILAPSVVLAYGIMSDLTVSVRLPFVKRQDIRAGHHSHVHGVGAVNEVEERGDTSGIGDLTVLNQYRFLNNRSTGTEATLLFGFKAPTGKTNEVDAHGELFEAEFQPGSGSWDGLFGLAFSHSFGIVGLHASGLYSLVSEGIQDTDLGDRFHYGIGISYRLAGMPSDGPMKLGGHRHGSHTHAAGTAPHAHDEPRSSSGLAVDLVLELNGEWSAKQESAGEKDPNSGGHTLYLSPGVRLSGNNMSAFVSVGVPVVNDLNGFQAEPDWRLFSGLAFAF